jgi:glycosyltransferase involved in cell wall biosynthesis
MAESHSQNLSDFLSETDQFMEQVDNLPFETAAELYDMLDEAAYAASLYIEEIDPELRVEFCDRQDRVLERIVDVLPPFEHSGNALNVYTPALERYRRWGNVELMKDPGLAGYMLAKEINAKPIMYFGTKPSDYPYLSVLPELEMLYDPTEGGSADPYFNHLTENYSDMDVLMLYGMYRPTSNLFLNAYRAARPDGKVYCTLDMSIFWMNKIPWDTDLIKDFTTQCDIIATTCRKIRDVLNRSTDKFFPCRWITNGFYNPTGIRVTADAAQKENIILTVGRIGHAAKNTEELLLAFSRVSDVLNDWTLRLVGPIDDELQPYIDFIFSERPELRERIIFTGPITDKEELYKEYAKAKIFILTSLNEGGTPNVYAEALFHGCMFITSDIDGADDITNFGEFGVKYKLHDIDALINAFINVCSCADLQGMLKHIPKALEYANKYYDWKRNAKKLAYMLFK